MSVRRSESYWAATRPILSPKRSGAPLFEAALKIRSCSTLWQRTGAEDVLQDPLRGNNCWMRGAGTSACRDSSMAVATETGSSSGGGRSGIMLVVAGLALRRSGTHVRRQYSVVAQVRPPPAKLFEPSPPRRKRSYRRYCRGLRFLKPRQAMVKPLLPAPCRRRLRGCSPHRQFGPIGVSRQCSSDGLCRWCASTGASADGARGRRNPGRQ